MQQSSYLLPRDGQERILTIHEYLGTPFLLDIMVVFLVETELSLHA
jgi:hypothetical protein